MQQEKAIKNVEGPCVILAGAGTGKTHAIVEKIKYIIENNIYPPEKIACITFSNEAVNNLISKVKSSINLKIDPVIKTFHSFSADLLRKHGKNIGINEKFNIITPDEARVVLYRFLKVPAGNCHSYVNGFSIARDLGIEKSNLEDYLSIKMRKFKDIDLQKRLQSLQFEFQTIHLKNEKFKKKHIAKEIKNILKLLKLKKFLNIWEAYEKIKNIKNYLDYSDLNYYALRLLNSFKELSKEYDYIIVDEFQDTNKIQLEFLYGLAWNKNITIVGDLNQSIYRFRGAYTKNIHEFKEKFNIKDNNIFNLDKSFRSSNIILRNAHKLILNNYANKSECFEVLNFKNFEGEKINVYELKNSKEEARKIAEIIENEINNGVNLKDICILFRTHQQGKIIKKTLESKKIPYISISKGPLLKEKSVKTVIDYLTILYNLKDGEKNAEQAWWDIIFQSDFLEDDLIKIGRFIKDNLKSENLCLIMLNSLTDLHLSDSGKLASELLVKRIKLMLEVSDKKVSELLKDIYRIGGLIKNNKFNEDKSVIKNLGKFSDLAKEHSALYDDDLGNFLYYLNILNSLGIEIGTLDTENNGVRLMTLHSTKGLEFKTVILSNMAEKRFPMERTDNESLIPIELYPDLAYLKKLGLPEEELEYHIHMHEKQNQLFEERRLCYVAFTRAKEKLILTYAGEYGGKNNLPSRFLEEIEYKKNKEISFLIDNNEEHIEPATVMKDNNFLSLFHDENIKETLIKSLKADNKAFLLKDFVFSPSSLILFKECEKRFEYKYKYNMPDQKTVSWESIVLGSFVHLILEKGVNLNLKSLKGFEDLAQEMYLNKEWSDIDINEALLLIKIFFERNNKKYSISSKTEQRLNIQLGGIKFVGFADRIDFNNEGLEITDYKTGKNHPAQLARNWQLGYYALAASRFGKVKTITLDMLRHEYPLEFRLDDKGNAESINSARMGGFNIYKIEQELIKTANEILNCFEKEFKPCLIEKNCDFCNEYIWRL